MLLTPTELERLTIYTAAELARKRRAKGLKLNHPEATAIIADEILEGAREGRSVADLISFGSTILTSDDVMPGVAELMPMLQVRLKCSRIHFLISFAISSSPPKRSFILVTSSHASSIEKTSTSSV